MGNRIGWQIADQIFSSRIKVFPTGGVVVGESAGVGFLHLRQGAWGLIVDARHLAGLTEQGLLSDPKCYGGWISQELIEICV